jgi:predicted ATPase
MSVLSRFGVLPAKNQQLGRLWMGQTGEAEALKSDITLEILVKSVMKSIFGDFDIKTETHNTMDRVSNTFSTDANQVPVRPVNTGFGISSTLPIIVGAFCLDEGDVLIVENPEVHLHPQAQSNLAKFLGLVALSGRQIIVETHSDHILNGFRVCAKSNSMASELIAINSITRAQDVRTVKFIQIDQDGNLTGVDKGFFDQIQKDLLSLF